MNIGIWGFGIVGQSALKFIRARRSASTITIFDSKQPSDEALSLAQASGASFFSGSLSEFLACNEHILVSPGVDLRAYGAYSHKFWCELDLFAPEFKKPLVAITGSLGKTSVTSIFARLLTLTLGEGQLPFVAAGNIGYPMLELALQAEKVSGAVMELSSFQLEHAQNFAPDIAIWTNMYQNHLDRHGSFEAYALAKAQIALHQRLDQSFIFPAAFVLDEQYSFMKPIVARCPAKKYCVASLELSAQECGLLARSGVSFVVDVYKGAMRIRDAHRETVLVSSPVENFPSVTFLENWLAMSAALHAMKLPCAAVLARAQGMDLLEGHAQNRCEFVAQIEGVSFYNDSKSTVAEATLKAVESLTMHNHNVIVILGGLSKGVDQALLLSALRAHEHVRKILCFGGECQRFNGIAAYPSLEAVVQAARVSALPGDCVLLSPAGASFDLFKDYKERGAVFKSLVFSMRPK